MNDDEWIRWCFMLLVSATVLFYCKAVMVKIYLDCFVFLNDSYKFYLFQVYMVTEINVHRQPLTHIADTQIVIKEITTIYNAS